MATRQPRPNNSVPTGGNTATQFQFQWTNGWQHGKPVPTTVDQRVATRQPRPNNSGPTSGNTDTWPYIQRCPRLGRQLNRNGRLKFEMLGANSTVVTEALPCGINSQTRRRECTVHLRAQLFRSPLLEEDTCSKLFPNTRREHVDRRYP